MGAFDNIIPECELPDEGAKRVDEWQTKDFDMPFMDKYRITADGRLLESVYHIEDQSEFARTGAGDRFAGCMTKVHDEWRDTNFHGVLNFYGNADGKYDAEHWYEYNAKFTDGRLVGIQRVTDRYGVSTTHPTRVHGDGQ